MSCKGDHRRLNFLFMAEERSLHHHHPDSLAALSDIVTF